MNMRSLKLFNAVLAQETTNVSVQSQLLTDYGVFIDTAAMWAKPEILKFLKKEKLSGNDLNKSFHKSWKRITDSSDFELRIEQIFHYITTYGTGFAAKPYIPNEVLNVPDVTLTFKVIKSYSKDELIQKGLDMLKSGIALKRETIDDIIDLLTLDLGYKFTGQENIKNKEAVVILADKFNVYPSNPVEFLRFFVYKTTGESLLIKNKKLLSLIFLAKVSNADKEMFINFGVEKHATIFNRFKPIYLGYKKFMPDVINRIGKLSKRLHVPMVENPLNKITSRLLTEKDTHWLDNATTFALFKAIGACQSRLVDRTAFAYSIRNGKSFVKQGFTTPNDICRANLSTITSYLSEKLKLSGKKVFIPSNVEYALPTSEKSFVGNFPIGTKFYGEKLAVGVYWENEWGARDLDISAISLNNSKIGWNGTFRAGDNSLLFSGDITDAPNGAVEYMYAKGNLGNPYVVLNNVFSGNEDCHYKLIVGLGDDITRDYMMNPNNLLAETRIDSVAKETFLGMFNTTQNGLQEFTVLGLGASSLRVSKPIEGTVPAFVEHWSNVSSLGSLLIDLGVSVVDSPEDADYDLSLSTLEKDSIMKIFYTEA